MVTHVAIVPFTSRRTSRRLPWAMQKELLQVTSALQTQVIRDFARFWDVPAVVSAFESLEDVPPHYIPIAITQDELPGRRRAFHFTLGGSAFALIKYEEDWSLAASHELLEILCDPTGQVTAGGPSLLDLQKKPNQRPQGDVDYLLEISDACETQTYKIDGVLVSDFVTPQFYDAVAIKGERYSFTGTITSPLTLLRGGYISWRTRLPDLAIFQADAVPRGSQRAMVNAAKRSTPQPVVPTKDLTIKRLTPVPARFTRDWIDSVATPLQFPASGAPPAYKPPAEDWAKAFRKDVQAFIKLMKHPRQATIDDAIAFVRHMTDAGNHAEYGGKSAEARTKELATKWNIYGVKPGMSVPKVAEFERRLNVLEQYRDTIGLFDPTLLDSGFALWMCMLTN
jgi:hypothetical protein